MTTIDTRPPLRLTASEAQNWFSLNSQDIGREVVIVEWKPAPAGNGPWPPRQALGYNAAGEWVWADEAEGRWP
jgi:hypothetical protein